VLQEDLKDPSLLMRVGKKTRVENFC